MTELESAHPDCRNPLHLALQSRHLEALRGPKGMRQTLSAFARQIHLLCTLGMAQGELFRGGDRSLTGVDERKGRGVR